tara:strand:+ start:348 stop:818 length:471 start_codon:yes stop_codon:yes gene_type:complete
MSKDKDNSKDKVRNISGLTPKQEKFVQGVLSGLTGSDAYRNAYDCSKMKDSSIHRESCVLMSNPKITARLRAGYRRLEDSSITSAISLRQMVTEQLVKEAKDTDNQAQSRIRALELIGKISEVALFTDRIETNTNNKTSDEIKLELEEKIQQMFGN